MPLTFADIERLTESFLTEGMVRAFRTVELTPIAFNGENCDAIVSDDGRAEVAVRHVRGEPDAAYLIKAFEEELLLVLQLNVHRIVIVYRVPGAGGLDASGIEPRLERWQTGATHAGWLIGWRDAVNPLNREQRFVECYCYATLEPDFLTNDAAQVYWRNDIIQMTRAFFIEAQRYAVPLSPRRAEFAF